MLLVFTVCVTTPPHGAHVLGLTGIWSSHLGLQLLDLFNQQGDVLQQVFVLQQQLMDPSLGLQPSRGLGTQLVLQQVDLRQDGSGGRKQAQSSLVHHTHLWYRKKKL